MRAIGLIPARGGSKRIPGKNIKLLGGKPLIVHSIILAQVAGLEVWVSTENPAISETAAYYGAMVIQRPWSLAQDSSTDFEVIRHALSVVEADLVVYLRPTTPFRTVDRVKEAVRLMSVPGYDSLRSVEEMSESAFKCFRIRGGLLDPLTLGVDVTDKPNQELPKTYHPNGYVDIVRKEVVDSGSLWGRGRYAFITPPTVEIDTPEQWEYAEYLCWRRK